MKFNFIQLLIAVATAQGEGEACSSNDECEIFELYCATWEDSEFGPQQTCEDCKPGANTFVYDSFGRPASYECPPDTPLIEFEEE